MGKLIGAHLSISKGLDKIQKQMDDIGAKCCAIFLKNQKRFVSAPLKHEIARTFIKNTLVTENVVPHGSYLINLGNPDTIEKSYECLIDDLQRCNNLNIKYYNLHPGSDVKKMKGECLNHIAKYLNKAIDAVPSVVILLENMAGQGNVVCHKFEDLKCIIEHINDKKRIGVCLDTCHMFGAGYDIRTPEQFEKVIKHFDDTVGLDFLKAMHLNDSKTDLGSRKDRHEHLGEGKIGLDAFKYIMNSTWAENIPLILETPDETRYKDEINLLHSLINN